MKIAIIGSGISGLYAAWQLSKQHQVTVFEKNHYFGDIPTRMICILRESTSRWIVVLLYLMPITIRCLARC